MQSMASCTGADVEPRLDCTIVLVFGPQARWEDDPRRNPPRRRRHETRPGLSKLVTLERLKLSAEGKEAFLE